MNPESTFGMRRPVNHLEITRCEIQWQSKLCITFSIASYTFTCRIVLVIRSSAIFIIHSKVIPLTSITISSNSMRFVIKEFFQRS